MIQEELNKIADEQTCPGAIIIKDKKILLGLRNYTPDKWKDISVWTTPGGRCDLNETIETALRREVREEVGITDLNIIDFIGQVPGAKDGDIVPLFYCNTTQEPKLMEPEKFSEWLWVPIAEYVSGELWKKMNPAAHRMISDYIYTLK